MDNTPDISRIIGALLQNPELLSQIKSAISQGDSVEAGDATEVIPTSASESEETEVHEATPAVESEVEAVAAPIRRGGSRSRRKELLCALKAYVSPERAKAINTMLSLTDVLDVMRQK